MSEFDPMIEDTAATAESRARLREEMKRCAKDLEDFYPHKSSVIYSAINAMDLMLHDIDALKQKLAEAREERDQAIYEREMARAERDRYMAALLRIKAACDESINTVPDCGEIKTAIKVLEEEGDSNA